MLGTVYVESRHRNGVRELSQRKTELSTQWWLRSCKKSTSESAEAIWPVDEHVCDEWAKILAQKAFARPLSTLLKGYTTQAFSGIVVPLTAWLT